MPAYILNELYSWKKRFFILRILPIPFLSSNLILSSQSVQICENVIVTTKLYRMLRSKKSRKQDRFDSCHDCANKVSSCSKNGATAQQEASKTQTRV